MQSGVWFNLHNTIAVGIHCLKADLSFLNHEYTWWNATYFLYVQSASKQTKLPREAALENNVVVEFYQ